MKRLMIVVAAALAAANPASAQSSAVGGFVEQAEVLVSNYHEEELFNGAILVAEGDDIIYEAGFGEADMSWGNPNSPETKFRIASVTKQFTAALVLKLTESGEIDLQASIKDYLPDYPSEAGDRITIHNLLSHTSGIPNYTSLPGWNEREQMRTTPDAFIPFFASQPLSFTPGERFDYSNSNYFLLGAIIEKVTGQPYADALRERVLVPLGLDNTGYHARDIVVSQMARGYNRGIFGYEPEKYVDVSLPYAAGMLFSTVRDLHRWKRALHSGEVFQNPETLKKMLTAYDGREVGYGYGLGQVSQQFGTETVVFTAHGGRIEAFRTEDIYVPSREWTVIVASNTGGRPEIIARNLLALMLGQPFDRLKRPIALELAEVIADDGVSAAVARYRNIKEEGADNFDMSENQLNALAYEYLGRSETEIAVQLFELNAEMFPESFNVYDSLGEGYFAVGRLDEALANYRRSLVLNPDNDNANVMIERIEAAKNDK